MFQNQCLFIQLRLIDNNPSKFRKYCENYNNPISSYVEYKLFKYIDQPLFGQRQNILYINGKNIIPRNSYSLYYFRKKQ